MSGKEEQIGQQVLKKLLAKVKEHVHRAVGQSLPPLAAPEWSAAVVAAAGAHVAGRAEAAAAQRLINEVSPALHSLIICSSHCQSSTAKKEAIICLVIGLRLAGQTDAYLVVILLQYATLSSKPCFLNHC